MCYKTYTYCHFSSSYVVVTLGIVFLLSCYGFSDELHDARSKQAMQIEEYALKQSRGIKKQQEQFRLSVSGSIAAYNCWYAQRSRDLKAFKEKVKRKWGNYISPTNKVWVEYSSDTSSVATVDFAEGTATVAVLVAMDASQKQIEEELTDAVERVVSSKGSCQSIPCAGAPSGQLLTVPVLDRQVIDFQGENVTVDRVSSFAQGLMQEAVSTPVVVSQGKEKPVYQKVEVSFRLAPDHLQKRIALFMPLIQKYCTEYNLDPAEVLATIHAESQFNPLAISGSHAIGLMQLVPARGGREAYRFVYGEDAVPQDAYLLDPEHNIELGCAYMYLLENRYFASVNDSVSRRYCMIAAYNTGPANVSYVFDATRSMERAAAVINGMRGADAVYERLAGNLPYRETRVYLADVTGKINLYR